MLILNESDRHRAFDAIAELDLSIKWQMDIKEYKDNRTLAQNALLWLWLTAWGNYTGYTETEMYDVAVSQCWPIHDERLICNDIDIPRQRRTSQLKVKPFTIFLENIDRLAATMGCILPHPEDMYYSAMGLERR